MSIRNIAGNPGKDKEIKEASSCDRVVKTLGLTQVFSSRRLRSILRFSRDGDCSSAVNNPILAVPRGAIYGHLGPNGANKTTTIKMLIGLLRPTRGTASICGHNIDESLHKDIRRLLRRSSSGRFKLFNRVASSTKPEINV